MQRMRCTLALVDLRLQLRPRAFYKAFNAAINAVYEVDRPVGPSGKQLPCP